MVAMWGQCGDGDDVVRAGSLRRPWMPYRPTSTSWSPRKAELRQRLSNQSKRTIEGLRGSPVSSIMSGMAGGVPAGQSLLNGSGPVQVKDSPLLLQQIDTLRYSVKHLKHENNRLKSAPL
ncbi:unnamed protein product [Ranitomeya imitator]|uniref:Uncharacterized protein n=1 Tax=Ranitomeya imitator TaxID=111125 RepID=A0ABN9LTP1_9NEOB|nr:unnamed protein product [Ranitomeya imitator]